MNQPNAVDYLTLAAAVFSPILAAGVTIWTTRRTDREKFDAHIEWDWDAERNVAEYCLLHVHNRMTTDLLVTEISLFVGALRRRRTSGTAICYDDPSDIPFPAVVKAGQVRRFRIDDELPVRRYEKLHSLERAAGWLGRSAIWLKVVTAGQSAKFLPAEKLLPWRDRPKWYLRKQGESDA